ncbi:Apolipoprotein N-acyltransferase [Aggregatibacter aphrophilus]|uniref:Apolipoprotein N-acyltransferase n=1 Tax=Aggregatibacter aphrophilus TaxID=732 RepID=A0A336NA03_AGGAP|nr:Apolipoprotein N-acyltransferase [Aggregatibacter aphrophilus]
MPYELQTTNRYNKHHLVPFGEYVPLESLLRPLGSVFNLPMSAFQSGDFIQKPLSAKNLNFTAAICYEIILGAQLQKTLWPIPILS